MDPRMNAREAKGMQICASGSILIGNSSRNRRKLFENWCHEGEIVQKCESHRIIEKPLFFRCFLMILHSDQYEKSRTNTMKWEKIDWELLFV